MRHYLGGSDRERLYDISSVGSKDTALNERTPTLSSVPQTSRAEHLELVLEMSAVGIWELDVLTGAAWRNEQHDRIFGYEQLLPDWSYDRFLAHVVPEDREAVDELYGSSLRENRPWSFECRIRRTDGEICWISGTGRPIKDDGGRTLKLIGHVIDVTHTKRNEEHLRILIDELNHRVRNTLTVVQAIAARSFQDHTDVAQARLDFRGPHRCARGRPLASDRQELERRGPGGRGRQVALPYRRQRPSSEPARFRVSGPRVDLAAKPAVSLAMALGELVTNATKYGALGVPEGTVELTWSSTPVGPATGGDGSGMSTDRVEILWRERGGPSVERQRTGFGMALLERLMPGELNGTVDVAFDPEGLTCRIVFEVQPLGFVASASA